MMMPMTTSAGWGGDRYTLCKTGKPDEIFVAR